MASWRPLDTILEALGLDFGGFWDDFSKFSTIFGCVSSKWSLYKQNAENAKKAKNAKNAQPAQILPLNALSQVWVGGGVPPQGVFNPPPTEGVRSVPNPEVNSSKVQLQMPNLITLSPGCLDTPL